MRPRLLVLALPLVLLVGCKPPAPMPTVGSPAPKIVESGPPVTEAEAEAFGRQVVTAFNAKNVDALLGLVRVGELYQRAVSDANPSAVETKQMVDQFVRTSGPRRECQSWLDDAGGREAKVLRTRTRGGRRSVLVRFYTTGRGVDYFEFTLTRGPDDTPTAEDVYFYNCGETYTQTIRRGTLLALPGTAAGQQHRDNQPAVRQMYAALRARDTARAKHIFDGLPPVVRDEKNVQLTGMVFLKDDDQAYLAEVERFRRLHPNDPALDIPMVNYHIRKKDGKALADCLWRLDQEVGGDPALRVIAADFWFDQGKLAEAKRFAGEAVQAEDTLPGAYWVLAKVAAAEGDDRETSRQLKAMIDRGRFNLDLEALTQDEAFKRFVRTKEFVELKDWRAGR